MTRPDWREMAPEMFDVVAPDAGLFDAGPGIVSAPDDGVGTGDLLSLI